MGRMAPPDTGDSGNPFQSLLGDLMNMLGTNAPNQWEMTRSFAVNVATGGEAETNVEPVQRIRLEQLVAGGRAQRGRGHRDARVARRTAAGLCAGRSERLDGSGARLVAHDTHGDDTGGRAAAHGRRGPGAVPAELFDGDDPMGGMGSLLGQWATAIGPMFFGLQVGSVVGHLSQRALGQYPLAIPWAPSDELLLVTSNIASFADDWSLPEEEALLWVCARELASNSVLTRPGDQSTDGGAAPGSGRVLGLGAAGSGWDASAGWLRPGAPKVPVAWTSSRCRGCSTTPKRSSAVS